LGAQGKLPVMKKIKKLLKKILKKFSLTNKLLDRYGKMIKHTRYTKVIVLGNARTGSSFLLEGLATLPSLKMYDEIFANHNRTHGENYESIIGATFGKVNPSIKIVGFKLFYNHLSEQELEKFLKMTDVKVIHLIRENKFKTIVSLDKAYKTNQWHLNNEAQKVSAKIKIDVNTLMERMQRIINYENRFNELFADHDMLFLSYEKLASKPKEEFDKVSSFLHLPKIDLNKIKLKKQASKELSEDVENMEEITALLKDTEYQKYLS